MALSRVKTWVSGETLTAADLNAEFTNIIDNPISLISPISATLDLNGNQLTMDSDADSSITADTDDRFDFALSGTDLFRMDGTASTPVNGLTFIARATGSKPSIQALAADANAGLDLRDDNGNEILVLAAVASAVNEITITNAAAASEPSIAATGGDTDIDITLTPKGSGNVNISVGTLQVGGTNFLIDEDDFSTDSATRPPSQQSTKAYIASQVALRGYIDGLILSNNGTDPSHDIDISAGEATDDGAAIVMTRSSTLVKQIDASWAVGTNQGGLDGTESVAGTPDATTYYHVWLIRRSDTGVVDALYSESATSPTMPANYDQKRRIGAVLTDGSANITAFIQYDDRFIWDVPVSDFNANNPGTSAVTRTLTVPTGIKVQAIITVYVLNQSGIQTHGLITSLDQTDTAPSLTLINVVSGEADGNIVEGGNSLIIQTNTSAQVRSRLDVSNANTTIRGTTHGWIDPRGRNA